ncbi:retrovirus-related Pol polyprotein from transposon opus [Trichonephila clavipes]|nr:retrovirus-related Pol polyprotein from transposon opus [Trichonephila clavipes]
MNLADGPQTTGEALPTQVMIEIEGRSVLTKFIILAKGNRTLLGTDFLSSAGLVLDVKNICWYFWDNPTHKYLFGEELDIPSIVEKTSSNTCQLREGEGEGGASSDFVHVTSPWFKITWSVDKSPRVAEQCDVNIQSINRAITDTCAAQRFETLAIDLFGSLPESKGGKRWILIIEDCTTKWVELFALPNATAKECAITLINL